MSTRDGSTGGKKKKEGFNAPFSGLKQLPEKARPEARRPAPRPAPPPARAEPDDAQLFAQAMAGVRRAEDPRGSAPPPPPREARIVDDEAEALARLAELVCGNGPFDIAGTDEFLEGAAPGVDRRVVAALRRGEYAVQDRLDLHGLTRTEAKDKVDRFLTEAQRAGKRCVLIVHGRGLNSKDQIPVIKNHLRLWLQQGRIGKAVLAFATARPQDGGSGAVYALLRR